MLTIAFVFIVSVVHCTLDPASIPRFQTNIKSGIPVFKPKTSSNSNQPRSAAQESAQRNYEKAIQYSVDMKEVRQQILPDGYPKTKIYAYGGDCYDSITSKDLGEVYSWPGPAFMTQTRSKLEIKWTNNLRGKHMFTLEKRLNFMQDNIDFDNFIPTVVHIHGMASRPSADGGPENWFTFDGRRGARYTSKSPTTAKNAQVIEVLTQPDEATLFYHDHSLAMTRLNVYAGLGGHFLIRDSNSPLSKLFDKDQDIVLAVADRTFNEDGSLYYPDVGPAPQFPNWVPEYVGDVMIVNGKAYPNMNVERNRYRVRIINTCNSRTLVLQFKIEQTGAILPFLLYKSDSSYYYKPLPMNIISLPPAGRAEIVIDFTGITTKKVIMENYDTPTLLMDVMSFTPSKARGKITPAPKLDTVLNRNLLSFPFPSAKLENRYYVLYEPANADGNPVGVYINGVNMEVDQDIFRLSKDYDLYLINLTEDAHPIHIHLFNFQHYKWAEIDGISYTRDWLLANNGEPPYSQKPVIMTPDSYINSTWTKLDNEHRVWKDVSNVDPYTVSVFRIRLRYTNGQSFPFDVTGGYFMMHCHILEHEDNDMMRYFSVVP